MSTPSGVTAAAADPICVSDGPISSGEVCKLARALLEEAAKAQASDLHFNCQSNGVLVRLRVNGLMQDHLLLPADTGRRVVHHLKALGEMNIAEHRRPQDGRAVVELAQGRVDFRLATIHTLWGENLAVRIFDSASTYRRLNELGIDREGYQLLFDLIHAPQGLLLVTGPTGAGKTTTLYAILDQINRPDINVITVEDPVEHEIPRVNQIAVQPKIGLGFLECLRSALRQDPDVIMIGEIRDHEGARIAIRAALSGHLVLSTLHTGSAPEAIAALLHLGIEPFLIATALNGVLTQQLVRRICPDCRRQIELGIVPADLDEAYRREFLRLQDSDRPLSFSYGEGCDACHGTGYRGRTGVFEILRVTPAVRRKIVTRAPADAIEAIAVSEGMVTLRSLGVRLVLAGETTIEEVLRVVAVPEDRPHGAPQRAAPEPA